MSTTYTWGSAPVLSFTISDNISRDSGASYSGYLMVTLGGQLALADTPVGGYPVTFVLTFPE